MSEYILLYNLFGGFKGEPSYDEKHYDTGIIRIAGKNKEKKDVYSYFYVSTKKPISRRDHDRIIALKIPPGWNNVWISGNEKSDIQVVGIDSKNRKQYKYNKNHIVNAEKQKFIRLYDFIKAMPKLDKIIRKHSKLHVYSKNRVIATILTLVKELHLRVGKEQYAKKNKSYGVSSLKKSHIKFDGDIVKFNFKGKSNKRLSYTLRNYEIKTHLVLLMKLEGEKIFQFIDSDNAIKKISDSDINNYIQEYMGKNFSAKDFRTFAANYYFVKALLNETKKHSNNVKKNIINAIKISAKHLSHTQSISKKSYIMSYCVEEYAKHPEYFISHKYDDPKNVLIELLQKYKKNI